MMGKTMDALHAIDVANNFNRSEFPETVAGVKPELINRLQQFRDALGNGIHPSRHPQGWKREGDGRSRHYTGEAGDVFPDGDVLRAFLLACRYFGGVGIYFDTRRSVLQPGPMLHLDLRTGLTVWARDEGRYIYPARSQDEREEFWCLMWRHADQ